MRQYRFLWFGVLLMTTAAFAGETLYNGVVLPDQWPPKLAKLSREPLATPPYLVSSPAVIPIDVGRQLFVDDFLIAQTDLTRTHHVTTWHPACPVINPDRPWELNGTGCEIYSGGVWWDPADQLFKAFYRTQYGKQPRFGTCLATSRDGVKWDKPTFDVVPGTGLVLVDEEGLFHDSDTVWLDLQEKDPAKRWKLFRIVIKDELINDKHHLTKWMKYHTSPDGTHWTAGIEGDQCGDRTTVFRNPFRGKWVFGLRGGTDAVGRAREYYESDDPAHMKWEAGGKHQWTHWIAADILDPERHDLNLEDPIPSYDQTPVQLYNLDCAPYESLMVGLFTIWRGQPKDRGKPNELCVGYSRDGFHFTRPDRRAFIPVSEKKGDWNWVNVQSVGGVCAVVGDQLYFYCKGSEGVPGTKATGKVHVGLAVLRRDGFTSLDAGAKTGTLTTRPVQFKGKYLFVNVNCPQGELRVEALDQQGKVIAPFTRENCRPVKTDSTLQAVTWRGALDLAKLAGQPVRFHFHLTNGQLYAFWVSPDRSGASYGYVAAGGPGYTGAVDTVGRAAIR
jgi:hypothetical protein